MIDKSLREHYAFKILLACIAIKIGTGAVTHVCMGNFVAPITAEFGCEVSELTMFTSFNAIAMALLYTTAAKILTFKNAKVTPTARASMLVATDSTSSSSPNAAKRFLAEAS